MLKVYIVFGLGLGDDEDSWEVCDVKLVEQDAIDAVVSLAADTGGAYRYEGWDAK